MNTDPCFTLTASAVRLQCVCSASARRRSAQQLDWFTPGLQDGAITQLAWRVFKENDSEPKLFGARLRLWPPGGHSRRRCWCEPGG